MHDKLPALALLLLLMSTGSGCAMCDPNYPYGPTAGPHGGYYSRAGSVLEPMPYGAVPHVAPGQPVQAETVEAEAIDAGAVEADPMTVE